MKHLEPGDGARTGYVAKRAGQTATVTVGASDTKTQNFKFAMPAAK